MQQNFSSVRLASDLRPIGVFDSGLGGLTVVPYLLEALPEERVVYFGDTARTPYGSKSLTTIQKFSRQIVDFLVAQDCKAIVIACNTVSSTCLEDLRKAYPSLPIVGIIGPLVDELAAALRAAPQALTARRLGVIGTKVTVASEVYPRLLATALPGAQLAQKACPIFVPLIEEGLLDHKMMDEAIHYYLDDFVAEEGLTDLILGCTHYHLMEDTLQQIYPQVRIWNPAAAQVRALRKVLADQALLAGPADLPESQIPERFNHFYASDLSANFRQMIANIAAGQKAHLEFKSLDL